MNPSTEVAQAAERVAVVLSSTTDPAALDHEQLSELLGELVVLIGRVPRLFGQLAATASFLADSGLVAVPIDSETSASFLARSAAEHLRHAAHGIHGVPRSPVHDLNEALKCITHLESEL